MAAKKKPRNDVDVWLVSVAKEPRGRFFLSEDQANTYRDFMTKSHRDEEVHVTHLCVTWFYLPSHMRPEHLRDEVSP